MLHISARKARGFLGKVADEARFLKSWAENPLVTGAVSPSGPDLSRRMASFINPDQKGDVLELGPGTGVVTKSIIERGVPPQDVITLEFNPDFCRLLSRRYPNMKVVEGDAYNLDASLPDVAPGSLRAIVSSLPLFSRPKPDRYKLLTEALNLLQPGAPFIQFSYALVPPVKAEENVFSFEKTGWILLNLPPARVWVYRKTAI